MAEIRTFHPRRGRMSAAQTEAVSQLLPRHGMPSGVWDLDQLREGRRVALEIGFGLGHATLEMAQADPQTVIIAVDVHTPGVARLLLAIERLGLRNVRVVHDDAVQVLREQVPPGSLDEIRAFFPDPWPKARHHKRRLVRPDLVALMASRLRPGGRLHLATDWEPYAEAMLEVLDAEPSLVSCGERWAPRGDRPMTKFERAGIERGHEVRDLVYERVPVPPTRDPA